jgi:hypothetical protein
MRPLLLYETDVYLQIAVSANDVTITQRNRGILCQQRSILFYISSILSSTRTEQKEEKCND